MPLNDCYSYLLIPLSFEREFLAIIHTFIDMHLK